MIGHLLKRPFKPIQISLHKKSHVKFSITRSYLSMPFKVSDFFKKEAPKKHYLDPKIPRTRSDSETRKLTKYLHNSIEANGSKSYIINLLTTAVKQKHADGYVYNLALIYALEFNEIELFEKLYKELMGDRNISPVQATFKHVIKYYSSVGNIEKAKSVWNDMKRRVRVPDASFYAELLPLFINGSSEDIHSINELKKVMEQNEVDPGPYFTEKAVLEFAKARPSLDARQVVEELKGCGFVLTAESFDALLRIFCKNNNIEDIETMLDILQENSLVPTNDFLHELMKTYNDKDEPKNSLRIYSKLMVPYQLVLDANILYEFFRSYHLLGHYDTLFRFYDNLMKSSSQNMGNDLYIMLFDIAQHDERYKPRSEGMLNDIIFHLNKPNKKLILKMLETFTYFKEMKNLNAVFKYANQKNIHVTQADLDLIKSQFL